MKKGNANIMLTNAIKKTHTLRFREVDRDIFNVVRRGEKRIETRAATVKFLAIQPGDTVRMVCGKSAFEKQIKGIALFKTLQKMLKKYSIKEINPAADSFEELEKMYYSFPAYREKIKKHGLIVFTLE